MIIGAGLAGLIIAHALPAEQIVEVQPEPVMGHRAVLRFRAPIVGELTGIDFRPVTVHKGLWHEGKWNAPSINLANMYSRKVLGRIADRSIWALDTVTRWIAPETFYEQLLAHVSERITWNFPWSFEERTSYPVISTAPLPAMASGMDHGLHFHRAPITVRRYRVPSCDVYQTVYYPSLHHSMYRASITGNLLTCEFAGTGDAGLWVAELRESFSLHQVELTELGEVTQHYGKIASVPEDERRALIHSLTEQRNIFCIGRFATWRNILLDDVVHDISVVRRLITATHYERSLVAIQKETVQR